LDRRRRRAAREDLEMTARELNSNRLIALPGDVTDAAHRGELVAAATGAGPLALVVNNASRLGPSPQPALADYPEPELWAVYQTNLFAPLALIRATLPALKVNAGAIVNLTSDAAVEPYPGWGGYGSSKAAFDQLSAILAAEICGVPVYAFDPRATCPRRCIRPRSPGRTSPIAPSRSPSCLHCCGCSTPGRSRAVTGQRIWR
jgi:NAD(P)-dependent dehydrogenase (short-subunit alcohol dehydrogenase family)